MSDLAGRLQRLSTSWRRLLELRRSRLERPGAPPSAPSSPDRLPLTPEQEGTWRRYACTPETFYNCGIPLRLSGPLDVPTLERSIEALVARHPALRVRIEEVGGPFQRVAPAAPVALPVLDLPDPTALADRLRDLLGRRLDPRGDRLWRASLLRLHPGEHVLAMTLDELVCDARSRINLMRELLEVYEASREGRAPRLPTLTLGYGEYAELRRRWLSGPEAERTAAAARAELDGARLLPLAGDRPRPAARTFRGSALFWRVPAPLVRRLRELTEREGATLYVCLAAAFSALLARYAGRPDVVLTTHVVNRLAPGSEHLVGNFTAYVLPRCRWTGDPSFRELLGVARRASLAAFTRKELPAATVAERLGWGDYAVRSPVSQFYLAVHEGDGLEAPAVRSLEPRFEYVYLGRFGGELGIFAYRRGDGIDVRIEYSAALFEAPSAVRFRDHLAALLERACARPERRLSSLLAGIDRLAAGATA